MGPYFDSASTRIGRKRLPPGLVAMIEDPFVLREGIRELHEYATTNRQPNRPRRGIVFRVVEAWEQHAIMQRVCAYFGQKLLARYGSRFAVRVGDVHVVDDSVVSHAFNRHAIEEGAHQSHLGLMLEDFQRIPEVVDPRYIAKFTETRGMPRIVYERAYERFVIVVIEEIRAKAGVVVKTAYKRGK